MAPNFMAIIALTMIAVMLLILLPCVFNLQSRDHWYDQGWSDCNEAHHQFAMTPEDMQVLRELKFALRAHIKAKGYQCKGDIKKIDRAENLEDLKHVVWEICILRKEKK